MDTGYYDIIDADDSKRYVLPESQVRALRIYLWNCQWELCVLLSERRFLLVIVKNAAHFEYHSIYLSSRFDYVYWPIWWYVTYSQVIILDLPESSKKLSKGESVLAVYPDTTAFYQAIVSQVGELLVVESML